MVDRELSPKTRTWINVLFWIAAVACLVTVCICGGMIAGWW